MCGIATLVSDALDAPTRMRDATELLRHRGPDEVRTGDYGGAVWGMARLAIRDPEHGRQPFETNDVSLIFNGEIYNAEAVLSLTGRDVRSRCDTEVLLQGYLALGDKLFEHLDGMFAVVLYDRRRGKLLLARDRFGQKPLYYGQNNATGEFACASELAAMTRLLGEAPALDLEALAQVLRFQAPLADKSAFQGVLRVLPGQVVTVDLQGGATTKRALNACRAQATRSGTDSMDLEAAILADVADHVVSDRPLGLFLSGGIDSAVIAMALSRLGMRVPAFTLRRPDEHDESPVARRLAALAGHEHVEVPWTPGQDVVALAAEAVDIAQEPLCDAGLLPIAALSRAAAQSVTVALTGDGGDELFGGYPRYRSPLLRRRELGRLARRLPAPREVRTPRQGLRMRLAESGSTGEPTYTAYISQFSVEELRGLLGTPQAPAQMPTLGWLQDSQVTPTMARYDLGWYLPDVVLAKGDRASMHHSLELRAPLLGQRTSSFSRTLSVNDKLKDGTLKAPLKELLARWGVDREYLGRSKSGFSVSLAADMVQQRDACISACSVPAFDGEFVKMEFDALSRGETWRERRCWSLLVSAEWLRRQNGPSANAL